MQCLLVSLRRSAMLSFILSAYCAGMPGIFISRTVTFDCQSPGSTIDSLAMTPDCFTAAATSFPVAFLTFTVGPLLQATRHDAKAATHTAYFIGGPPLLRGVHHKTAARAALAPAPDQCCCVGEGVDRPAKRPAAEPARSGSLIRHRGDLRATPVMAVCRCRR